MKIRALLIHGSDSGSSFALALFLLSFIVYVYFPPALLADNKIKVQKQKLEMLTHAIERDNKVYENCFEELLYETP